MSVRHDAQARRFTAATDEGGEAYLTYELAGDRMDIQHTVVPPESQGGGIGASLVQAAADHARAQHLRVIPTCPFADAWFRRHHAASDLLVSPGAADAQA